MQYLLRDFLLPHGTYQRLSYLFLLVLLFQPVLVWIVIMFHLWLPVKIFHLLLVQQGLQVYHWYHYSCLQCLQRVFLGNFWFFNGSFCSERACFWRPTSHLWAPCGCYYSSYLRTRPPAYCCSSSCKAFSLSYWRPFLEISLKASCIYRSYYLTWSRDLSMLSHFRFKDTFSFLCKRLARQKEE